MTSNNYNKVKEYYDNHYWTIEQVKHAVVKNWITAEEYKLITNEEYVA